MAYRKNFNLQADTLPGYKQLELADMYVYVYVTVRPFEDRNNLCDIKIQFVPHRERITFPLEKTGRIILYWKTVAVYC
jgi:hypothetical protein